MSEVDNIKLLNLSYEQTPDTFAKRCIKCQKLIFIKKKYMDKIIICPSCKISMKITINISKDSKLESVENDTLTRQELNELNASQEDCGSPPRWY